MAASKKDKKKKKDAKKGPKAQGVRAAVPASRAMVEPLAEVVLGPPDGPPVYRLTNALLCTSCLPGYSEGMLSLVGSFSLLEPKG